MKRQPFCQFLLAGVSLTDWGLEIPSPFCSLTLSNSEINSFTSWQLNVVVGGDSNRKMNVAAFEALLYSAAQSSSRYNNSSGIPVSFIFGWTDDSGNATEYLSYQGFTIKFSSSVSGLFTNYTIEGFASLAMKSAMPVLNVPSLCGYVQPSAVLEGLAIGVKATTYYDLDIDHNDVPTIINHGAMTTSLTQYVKGTKSGQDDYNTFPGLITFSKSYNATRDAAGLRKGFSKLSTIMNNVRVTPVSAFLKKSLTDNTPQCSSFYFWIDEPTMTRRGTIHYKSAAGLQTAHCSDTLEYGTSNTNILSLSGSYNGIAYNISNMNFSQLGFNVDGSGKTIANPGRVTNSWSNSLAQTFQSASIINDINALATQFSGKFEVTIAGSVKQFGICNPVSLIIMSGNTLSPASGVYSIMSVSHNISNTFTTTLTLQRLVMSSANQTALSQGLYVPGTPNFDNAYTPTSNIISPSKVDFGVMYPTFEDIVIA